MRQIPFDPEILARMPAGDSLSGVQSSVIADEIRDAVEALPDLERSVIEMAIYERIDKADIGRRLGMPRTSVWGIYTRALRLLEPELRRIGGELYGDL